MGHSALYIPRPFARGMLRSSLTLHITLLGEYVVKQDYFCGHGGPQGPMDTITRIRHRLGLLFAHHSPNTNTRPNWSVVYKGREYPNLKWASTSVLHFSLQTPPHTITSSISLRESLIIKRCTCTETQVS